MALPLNLLSATLSPTPPAQTPPTTEGAGGHRSLLYVSLEAAALAVTFALLALYVLRSMYGIDVFWHIKAGQLILENGAIPQVDTFSAVTPDRPWTPFQWLYEVFVYGVDQAGGLLALRLVNAALLLAGFGLLYRAARREVGPAAALFALALTVVLFEDRFRVRPHVFNLLFLAALLPSLLGGWRRLRWRGIIAFSSVGWVWANIHAGGALLVPVSLGGVGAGALLRYLLRRDDERRAELWQATRLFAVAVLPMLLMPGFLKGVYTAIAMYGASLTLIPEWSDPTAYFDLLDQRGAPHYLICGFTPYVMMTALGLHVVVRVLRKETEELPWSEILLSALMLYLAQRSLRFVYLSVIPALVLFREWGVVPRRAIAPSAESAVPSARGRGGRRLAVTAALLVMALGASAASYHYNIVVQRGSLAKAIQRVPQHLEPGRFPTRAADFMHASEVEGGILHFSKWGGYLLWKLWPRCRVFADGRGNFDTAQVGALVATHRPLTREAVLEKAWRLYGFDIVMFQAPVFPLMTWDRDRWVRIWAGVEHNAPIEVFVRNDERNAANIERVRAWYAARSDDRRFAPDAALPEFEKAIAQFWGERWLAEPRQQRRLAKLAERANGGDSAGAQAHALFRRAMLYYNAGFPDRALVDLMAADQRRPGTPRTLYYLGWTLYRLDRPRPALAALSAAARADQEPKRKQLRPDELSRGQLLLEHLTR